MESIHQKVRQQIEGVLSQQCGAVKREQIMTQLEGYPLSNQSLALLAKSKWRNKA
jgi:hypothetical protein